MPIAYTGPPARDAVALPWEALEREADARGVALADLIAGRRPG